MFTKILVGLDGSECALAAARAAAAIARHHGSEIIGLNVFHPIFAGPAEIGTGAMLIDTDVIDLCAQDQMQAVEHNICPVFAGLIAPHRVVQETGHPAEAILRVAEREKVDLIVVGSRGLRGIKELFLGSTSSAVLHHAPCPVLIVRAKPESDGAANPFQHILLASDGSPHAQGAAVVAVELAQTFATSLTVLNVSEGLSVAVPGEKAACIGDETTQALAKSQIEVVHRNVSELAKIAGVYCSFVEKGGYPDEAIVEFAKEHRPDVIVLGSRGSGGFEQIFVGSVSNYVAHHTSYPVLVVR